MTSLRSPCYAEWSFEQLYASTGLFHTDTGLSTVTPSSGSPQASSVPTLTALRWLIIFFKRTQAEYHWYRSQYCVWMWRRYSPHFGPVVSQRLRLYAGVLLLLFSFSNVFRLNTIDIGRRTVCACDAAIHLTSGQARCVMVGVLHFLIYLPRRTALSYYRVKFLFWNIII